MMKFCRLHILAIALTSILSACSNPVNSQEKTESVSPSVVGKFTPPGGQTLFILGQDNDSIGDYLEAIPSPMPGGVTSYTSLHRLEGIKKFANNGAGTVFLDDLVRYHPSGTIALGLYLENYLDDIVSGKAIAHIDRLLEYLASYDRPVYLRFGYEFDGPWNHYKTGDYKEAWIYFYNRMEEQGVTNIAMVWQSATNCDGTHLQQPIEDWYPGDEYVDWVGLSYFTQTTCDLQPLDEILEFARQHNKPVMIAESTPQRYHNSKLTYSTNGRDFEERTSEQIWEEWFALFFDFIYQNADVIRAVAYINAWWDSQGMWGHPYPNGYWGDSRVEVNEFIKGRWLEELEKPMWLFASPDLFEKLDYRQ